MWFKINKKKEKERKKRKSNWKGSKRRKKRKKKKRARRMKRRKNERKRSIKGKERKGKEEWKLARVINSADFFAGAKLSWLFRVCWSKGKEGCSATVAIAIDSIGKEGVQKDRTAKKGGWATRARYRLQITRDERKRGTARQENHNKSIDGTLLWLPGIERILAILHLL